MGCLFRDLAFVCVHVCISSSWLPSQRRKLKPRKLILEVYLDLAPTKIISHRVITYLQYTIAMGPHTVTELANSSIYSILATNLCKEVYSYYMYPVLSLLSVQPAPLVTIIFSKMATTFFLVWGTSALA